MSMNLRTDDTLAEDEGWHRAAERYSEFLRHHEGQSVLFLELAVGNNTPSIIRIAVRAFCIKTVNEDSTKDIKEESICRFVS